MSAPDALPAAPGSRGERDEHRARNEHRARRWHDAVRGAARVRAVIKRSRSLDTLYRISITAIGALIVVVGLILVPLPGPGWLIVFFGLAILGTEFHWARRLLGWARMALARFTERWRAWRARRAAYGT